MNSFACLKIENKHNLLCVSSFECVLNPKLDLKVELYEQYFSLGVVFYKIQRKRERAMCEIFFSQCCQKYNDACKSVWESQETAALMMGFH